MDRLDRARRAMFRLWAVVLPAGIVLLGASDIHSTGGEATESVELAALNAGWAVEAQRKIDAVPATSTTTAPPATTTTAPPVTAPPAARQRGAAIPQQRGQSAAPASRGRGAGGGLAAIRSCESGGNYGAVSANGRYRGAYQFDQQTWQSVGGTGDPAAASPAEQDARAAQLRSQRGSNPWPNCG